MGDPVAAYVQAARAFAAASSAIVCGHVDPDGDAIGSTLALTHVLRRLGIDAVPALAEDREAPDTYSFMPGFTQLRYASELEAPSLLVALDTPNPARLGNAGRLAEGAGTTVVIDHHPDNTCYGDINLVDPTAAAAGQIIWRLLPLLEVPADTSIALATYVAVLTDTGRFQYSNSDAAVLRDAAAMIDTGLDVHEIYERIYENQTLGHLELVGRVKSRVRVVNGGRVGYSWVTNEDFAETGATNETTENLVDSIRVLGDVDVVFLAKLAGETCRVSLRAKGHGDVGGIARHFGGGGHVAAAGFSIPCDLDALLVELLPLLPGGGEA